MNEKSIAVLPFLNMSSDPENDYFSDGVTEEIINALTTIKGLKVSARTSSFAFKNRQVDVRHIGNRLGVATLLEGSIRKFRGRVRISAQLVRTDDGFHIWSGKFDRELADIFELQDEISLAIAEQIRENFGHLEIGEHLVDAPTDNTEAYSLYLKARHNHLKWDGEGINNAIRLYEECIGMDPDFSWPYFGAAYCYTMYGSWGEKAEFLDIAENYIDRGFRLDETSFLGYYSKATLLFWGRWDFPEAHSLYSKAISLNPSYTEAEEGLVELYIAIGDFDRAMHHVRRILALDPLSKNHHFTIANIHYLSGQPRKAVEYLESGLNIDPDFTHLIELMQLCLIQLKQYGTLNDFLAKTPLSENPEASRALYRLMHQPASVNRPGPDELTKDRQLLIPWALFLQVHMGYQEAALDILEEAVRKRAGQYMNFMTMPLLEPIRHSDRFKKLVRETFRPSVLAEIEEAGKAENGNSNPGIGHGREPLSTDSKSLMPEEQVARGIASLKRLMDEEKKFLDSSLTLREVAEMLQLHPNKLSWLLNDRLGMNFNDYVNSHRLAAFQQKALDPANGNFTLLGLAFDSGFNSKSAFNDYFKKKTGMTPRGWLKKQK